MWNLSLHTVEPKTEKVSPEWFVVDKSGLVTDIPCPSLVAPSCSLNEYVCASGGCVSASLRCDGHDNCLDGSDEVSAASHDKKKNKQPENHLFWFPVIAPDNITGMGSFDDLRCSFADRLAVWRSAGKMSFSAWIVHTASLGAGAVMMCWTAWITVMRKTAARVSASVFLEWWSDDVVL